MSQKTSKTQSRRVARRVTPAARDVVAMLQGSTARDALLDGPYGGVRPTETGWRFRHAGRRFVLEVRELVPVERDEGVLEAPEGPAFQLCTLGTPGACSGRLWTCERCRARFCEAHWHETSKGRNVECTTCEESRERAEGMAEHVARLTRDRLLGILRSAAIALRGDETDEELREALRSSLEDGTIDGDTLDTEENDAEGP
jgi:hypothetical protein